MEALKEEMMNLEKSFARELRMKVRQVRALQREMKDMADYFKEIVFLVDEHIKKDDEAESNADDFTGLGSIPAMPQTKTEFKVSLSAVVNEFNEKYQQLLANQLTQTMCPQGDEDEIESMLYLSSYYSAGGYSKRVICKSEFNRSLPSLDIQKAIDMPDSDSQRMEDDEPDHFNVVGNNGGHLKRSLKLGAHDLRLDMLDSNEPVIPQKAVDIKASFKGEMEQKFDQILLSGGLMLDSDGSLQDLE